MNKIEDYGECFIEEYIDGREFNISLIGTSNAPLILPYAEIKFLNFPPEKSKIVGYDAKWDKNSFEYQNTVRSFEFNKTDQSLLDNLKYLALKCWEVFRIDGYARVDFRVDSKGIPYILEINVNPCISPDSGFFAAC